MNKKLLAIAIGAALAAPVYVAQADVTVYGKAHVSIDRENKDGGTIDNTTVSDNSSRLGIRFSEDLGGGLKGIGQYEAAIGLDGEKGFLAGQRNTFVGLSSDTFGTVLAGKRDTPFKDLRSNIELFPEQIGDARNLTAPGAANTGWDLRLNNMVAYATPSWAGVSAMVAWVSDAAETATTGDNNQKSALSASVTYKGGPLYVAGAYERHDSNLLTGGPEDESAYRIAASGTFGMFKVIGLVQQMSDINGVAGADRTVYGIGGSVTLAEKHVIKAQFYNADALKTATTDDGAQMFVVGYDYKFSKKTTGYVAYAKTNNDAAGTYLVSDPGTNRTGHGEGMIPGPGQSVQATSIGLIMDF